MDKKEVEDGNAEGQGVRENLHHVQTLVHHACYIIEIKQREQQMERKVPRLTGAEGAFCNEVAVEGPDSMRQQFIRNVVRLNDFSACWK